jgi:hypothetical protein
MVIELMLFLHALSIFGLAERRWSERWSPHARRHYI